jgi:plasmid stabilization system protein ParE
MRQRGKVRWTRRAAGDLLAIGEFIAKDNPAAARRFVERLRQRARDAARAPLSGRVVPEVERTDLREVFVGNYRIVYRTARSAIEVLTVFEGHRLLAGALHEEEA